MLTIPGHRPDSRDTNVGICTVTVKMRDEHANAAFCCAQLFLMQLRRPCLGIGAAHSGLGLHLYQLTIKAVLRHAHKPSLI